MTKGGNGKPKTLGRLIFGEKRKQHTSPSRHRSSTRNGGSMADLSTSAGVTTANKNPINIHEWAVWRMQLNEQLGSGITDRRLELKQMRHFLQTSLFYQQHSRVTSNGRHSGVRLLFSIPRAKFKPELLDSSRAEITKTNNNETGEDITPHEQTRIRSTSDERTASVTSVSTVQPPAPPPPIVVDKTISQLFPKALIGNTGDFLQVNEQMVAADIMRTRRIGRSSFKTPDRIHSTLQKAVKDGNVLEKIKAFEMQAAAAQAESAIKLGGLNHRMQTVTASVQSAAHRTLSPVVVHPVQQPISPAPIQQQQPIRSNRGHHVHPVQHRRDVSHGPIIGRDSRKGAHVLEPAHGDIILKRRTPSQKTVNDEDYSITAISSVAVTTSQGHHQRNRHHRTSLSRSRHRQEMTYDKRAPSNHENPTHKHQQKQKRTISPSSKPSTRRRWLKSRKETPTETTVQSDKQETPTIKSNKTSKNKKKTIEAKKASTSGKKGKSSSDNNRVYGVPNADTSEQTKIESPSPPPSAPKIDEKRESDPERNNTNTYIAAKEVELSHNKEGEPVLVTTIQRRSSKKHHQHKLSSTDGEILSRVDENTRLSSHPTDDPTCHFEDDVFLEDSPIKLISNVTRHQSVVNLSNHESHRPQRQSSIKAIQRHASHCSAEELTPNNQRYQRLSENFLKKKPTPITLITRKNKINRNEHNVYETPHSEQTHAPVCNTHTLKKKRSFHTVTATGSSSTNGQTNNKQISKQILHAIMNSMNNNHEQSTARAFSVNDEFFENGPLTNPEETSVIITPST